MLTDSVNSQATVLAPIRHSATDIDATVAMRIRRDGSMAFISASQG